MKNRKTILIAFLLVATLTFGFGYAVLTDQLTINGTAKVEAEKAEDDFDSKVYFSAVSVGDAADQASIPTEKGDVAGFTVNSLAGAGDTATFTFTIMNESDLDATVTPTALSDASNNQPDYFDLVSDWLGQPQTIPAGQSKNYVLTVSLKQTPTTTINASFQIILDVASVDPTPAP